MGIYAANKVADPGTDPATRAVSVAELTPAQYNAAMVDSAGTAFTLTAAEANLLTGTGVTSGEIAELDASAAAVYAEGNHLVRVAQATYDVAVDVATAGAHLTGVSIPNNCLVLGGMVDVQTTFTDGVDDSATIAIHVQSANDIITATSVATGTTWDQGLHAIVPLWTAATAKKTTASREITVTTAVRTLTAGKMTISLFYIPTLVNV